MKREYRFGDKIREFRQDRGWSQEDLAAAAGLAVRTIQRAERDETKVGTTLRAIAAAFNIEVKDLKTPYWVAEARPPKSLMIESADDFHTAINRAHHIYDYQKLIPVKPELEPKVKNLMGQIFDDILIMAPGESYLESYIESLGEPLAELRQLGLSFFSMQECRDMFIRGRNPGERVPVEDITTGHFLLIPTYGCFQTEEGANGPLHRFSSTCEEAVTTLLQVTQRKLQIRVFINFIFAAFEVDDEAEGSWCNICFPKAADGSRLSTEDIQNVTGLSLEQIAELDNKSATA
jgi:transcriptional regulator with XRE-family HTH domain